MGINKLKTFILFIVCSFSLITCQNKKMEEKYIWTGTLSAPNEYPMQAYYGELIADDYQFPFSDIWGITGGGWGEPGKHMGGTDHPVKVPHTLEFTWYSLAENKFYAGHWELDTQKITRLFNEGFSQTYFDSLKKGTYDTFVIGLGPKGKLILWLYGDGHQVEVGHFQGKEIQITQAEAYDKFKYVFEPNYREDILNDPGIVKPIVTQKIKDEGYPNPDFYENFREKLNWRPKLILPAGSTLEKRNFYMANGERESTLQDQPATALPYAKRAVPYLFYFEWKNKDGKQESSQIVCTGNSQYIKEANKVYNGTFLPLDFEKTDMYKIFGGLDKEASADIVIDISSGNTAEIYIEQNGKKYPVTQTDKYVKQNK
ncbi:DUF2931 family protein [Chryseobacterium indologenes]|nr:hypothetical protein CRN76_12450 [Chryseobacterium indologenes]AYY85088.1 DUF2931 family protein [Chryseobacterium indologenes]AYZ34759.1 DUF2931 family protein [Chryseobacterium indologenes]MBF6643345.1 DUF2931 family protein [Chryseobacterium indologenes]MBU3046769.1 DUF2931 family protein [Chryseobacterium indologenes]